MRHATACIAALAIFFAAALGGVQRLVHRHNDIGHGNVAGLAAQLVAATGAAGGLHQLMPTQLAKELLQVGQRDLLALADSRQRDRPGVLAQSQINHGGDRKTAFGSKTHGKLLVRL